jgi:transposase
VSQPAAFTLGSRLLGPLPVINAFIDRLGLAGRLEAFMPHNDARCKLAPATAVGVVVRNLVIHREPTYALGEWAAAYDPALLGLRPDEVGLLNDDRVGRVLARLFDCDRASLLTRVVLDAITRFGLDTSQLHNDSTSIKLAGVHARADGRARRGKPTAKATWGHSKDHRPDLKQLLWILTVTADGAVPLACRVADGNTNDDSTHIATWDGLVAMLGRSDFLYVADCKLATRGNMDHIHSAGGRFVSVLPANRKEDAALRQWLADQQPAWTEALRRPTRGNQHADDVWHTTEAPWPSSDGYRLVVARSSVKIHLDAHSRRSRIAAATAALDDLNRRLASPKTRLKSRAAVEHAAATAVRRDRAGRWVTFSVGEQTYHHVTTERRGPRAGNTLRTRRSIRIRHHITWHVDCDRVRRDTASDGCYPLISNDHTLTGAQLLTAYKYQPHLEKRHAQLKGTQHVAPVFLKDPARIEGLLCAHFIAMLLQALIERHIRAAMADQGLQQLSLYPEDRGCAAPTAARVLDIFTGLTRHHLIGDGNVIQTFQPHLSPLQRQVLGLLDIPVTVYTTS